MAQTIHPDAPPEGGRPDFQARVRGAFALHQSGRLAEAGAICDGLLREDPREAQVWFLAGMVRLDSGQAEEARALLAAAAVLHPRSARIFNALGFVQQRLKLTARAAASYQRALDLGLRTADTAYSLGNVCHQLGDLDRATRCFEQAVAWNPRDAASWNNLGKCLNESNRLTASLAAYDRALAVDPAYALARHGRALTLLAEGRLAEGFAEYNQWRHHGTPSRHFPQPAWTGGALPGQTLFLHAEQGFGDAIQYARFLPAARALAGRVILECRPELKTLFVQSRLADAVIAHGETIPPFDHWASQASLPGILGVTEATIPNEAPWLTACIPPGPGKLEAPDADCLRVGLVWAGNPGHHNDAARSLRLADLAPLRTVAGVRFFGLQTPVPAPDHADLRTWSNLTDWSADLPDFLATATAIGRLDLVIAVDTGVAHLAGALARPVWTLLPWAPDWRWGVCRAETPWYPTMRLFRQTARHRWTPVIRQVALELARLASHRRRPPALPPATGPGPGMT